MKILFVSAYFGYKSGFNKAAGDILFSLLKSDHNLTVLTRHSSIKLPKEAENSFNIIKAPWKLPLPKIIKSSNLRAWARWLIRSFQDVARINYNKKLAKLNPDLIIINSYSNYLMPELDYDKSKTVFISHGSVESSELSEDNRFNVSTTIKLLSKINYLIFVSDNVRKQWLSFNELKNKKSYYVPNCTSEGISNSLTRKTKAEIANKLNFDNTKFHVICVANICERKGQDLLLKEIDNHISEFPDVLIHFIGDDNNAFAKRLKNKINDQNLNDHFIFHGVKKNALEFIYAADLFILPSRGEAFPLVILESMILNTPIIASDVNGIPEMIEDGVNGYLFSVDNIDIFWQKFKLLYSNTTLRDSFANNSKKIYWEKFSRQSQVERYNTILDEIEKEIL